MLAEVADNPDLLTIVIGNETWVYSYDMETKSQLSQMEASWRSKTNKRSNVSITIIDKSTNTTNFQFLNQMFLAQEFQELHEFFFSNMIQILTTSLNGRVGEGQGTILSLG